jgi:simple sugar transport system ATP-binding protein
MKKIVLERIDKYFPSSHSWANKGASLTLDAGEIHAVVGENGAGKTTLMRILAGLERPDAGSVAIDGETIAFRGPADAVARGIGMVHQHFLTIPGFTAAENIVFGEEPLFARFFVDRKALLARAAGTVKRFGFAVDPAKPAEALTVGERQQVEILKLLYRDCEVLILDEPTSVLAEREIGALFGTLRRLAAEGRTIVIITHKVREVLAVADTVTVMRNGATVGRYRAADLSERALSDLVMGADPNAAVRPTAAAVEAERPAKPGSRPAVAKNGQAAALPPALELSEVTVRRRQHGRARLDQLSLKVAPGEIIGVCALSGNGLAELEDLLAGVLKPSSGRLLFLGGRYPRFRAAPWRENGIAYVPSDRMRRGSCAERTVTENVIAPDRDTYFPSGILDSGAARKAARAAIEAFSVKAEPDHMVGELSGGNIQKLILARELMLSDGTPRLCVLCEPTWGLDQASTEFAYNAIKDVRAEGSAILVLSSDLDEILALSDRILALHGGAVAGAWENKPGLSREEIGVAMLGAGAQFPAGSAARAEGVAHD